MRANFVVLSALTAAALLGAMTASATVLTVAPGAPTFSGMSVHGGLDTATDPGTTTKTPASAELLVQAAEPETYALILAGLLFVGQRLRDQRR